MEKGSLQEFTGASDRANKRQSYHELDSLFNLYPDLESWYSLDQTAEPLLPDDFHNRLAIRIMTLFEKHTASDAATRLSEMLAYNITNMKMCIALFKTMRFFTHQTENSHYLSLTWRALLVACKVNPGKKSVFSVILPWIINDYENNRSRTFYQDTIDASIKHSFFAFEFGDHFVSLYGSGTRYKEIIDAIYSEMILVNLENISISDELAKKESFLLSYNFDNLHDVPYFERLLFNDVFDYLLYRTSKRGQESYHEIGILHTPQKINSLLQELSSIRSHIVHGVMRDKVARRKALIDAKLMRSELPEETIVSCSALFQSILSSYYARKRYQFDKANLDQTRAFLQGFCMFLGTTPLLYSLIAEETFSVAQGVIVFIAMSLFGQGVFRYRNFRAIYPRIPTEARNAAAEQKLFCYYLKKMSNTQLQNFILHQVRAKENQVYFKLIPELLESLGVVAFNQGSTVMAESDFYKLIQNLKILVNSPNVANDIL